MPRVSVIITTANRPATLREAIESVLSQTLRDFELLVVDDASTDGGTQNVIGSFSDPRVRHLRNQTRLGSTGSLNVGLRAAKGEYVAILDDDDAWIGARKLEAQVGFLDAHPDYVCVGSRTIVVDADSGRELVRSKAYGEDAALRPRLFLTNPFAHSTVVYRREAALRAGGYDERLPRGKDYDLWLKLATQGKVAVLPDYFVKYREVSDARDILARRLEDAKRTLEVMRRHRKNFPGTALPYLRQYVRYCIFRLLRVAPPLYAAYRYIKRRLR